MRTRPFQPGTLASGAGASVHGMASTTKSCSAASAGVAARAYGPSLTTLEELEFVVEEGAQITIPTDLSHRPSLYS